MCGTAVRKWGSTGISPRLPGVRPAAAEVQVAGVTRAAGTDEDAVARRVRQPEDKRQRHLPGRVSVAPGHPLVPVEPDPVGRHRRLEGAGHLAVEERQQRVPPVDQMHLRPQRGERAGVLAADHPGTDDRQLSRQRLQLEDLVRVVDPVVVERELGRPQGRRPGGDQDVLAPQHGPRRVAAPTRRVWGSVKLAGPTNVSTRVSLSRDSIRRRSPVVTCPSWRMKSATVASRRSERSTPNSRRERKPGQGQRRLPQRLARDGAGVDPRPADLRGLLDQGDPAAEQTGRGGPGRAGRAAADDHQVVKVSGHDGGWPCDTLTKPSSVSQSGDRGNRKRYLQTWKTARSLAECPADDFALACSQVAEQTAILEGRLIESGHTRQSFRKPREKQTEDYITGRFG